MSVSSGRVGTARVAQFGAVGTARVLDAVQYQPNAVDFDGTNDYLIRGAEPTGNADGKRGLVSFWFRIDGGAGAQLDLALNSNGNPEGLLIIRLSTGEIRINGYNAALTAILRLTTTSTFAASSTWHHFLASWDLGVAGARHIYVDDAADLSVAIFTDDTIDYTLDNFAIGANTVGTDRWNGALAEVYINTAEYLDFSVASNRRRFISSSQRPVYLGPDGRRPTGARPLIYLNGPGNNFRLNRGSGGDFTVTGSLDVASSRPGQ